MKNDWVIAKITPKNYISYATIDCTWTRDIFAAQRFSSEAVAVTMILGVAAMGHGPSGTKFIPLHLGEMWIIG